VSNRILRTLAFALILVTAAAGCAKKAEQSTPAAKTEPGLVPPSGAPTVPFGAAADPRNFIRAGRYKVDVMEPSAPPRAAELLARLQQSARENPDWWQEQMKKVKPGEPIPYDPRIGLSQTEYADFLAMSRQMKMQKQGEGEITVTSKGEGVYVLDGGEKLADLTGIEIDAVRREARTPFGVAREQLAFNASNDSALGAWTGVEWKLTGSNPSTRTGANVKLAVGKLHPSERAVLYYNVTKLEPTGTTRILIVLNYDLAPL